MKEGREIVTIGPAGGDKFRIVHDDDDLEKEAREAFEHLKEKLK